jgi:uncharacterized protein YwqG
MNIHEIYEAIKNETCIKSYKIEKEKADDLTIFDSKFGGLPYWDFAKEFPTDSKGEKLQLLAQINFDKEKFNDVRLPQKGILQFYISPNDDVYGINFDEQDNQIDWRVIYHENVNYEITEQNVKNNGVKTFNDDTNDYYAPFTDTYKISFKIVDEVMNCYDEKFNSIVAKILKDKFGVIVEENKVENYLEEIDEKYYNMFNTWGHKLLGYPAFTQTDPREYTKKYSKYNTLLLQIDTDNDIMWGDSGVANFFINKEDLENRNFSSILYNWDCC